MQDWIIIGPIATAIIGVYAWMGKHMSNSSKHPTKSKLVYKEVCETRHKGLEDCIEAKLNGMTELMKQGFSNVEELIKKNSR